ncbi:N-acetylmuramoyl-L-alanine amidase-like domain-containing protein [uncultured Bacteroides sp.]|uniref:N-acetylmuramoyl-L-alanine amidase-like domain-containing protein n=1 Tax=uncultured Bacteroides sp. TaxID=162156 RepID=UPI00262A4202|nr:N-acetylmuramoyl-L-alanine amidase-like domain-containing protein [uncultured Bacteroides sp.]
MSFNSGAERLLFFANSMKGIPYQGGTLDRSSNETLVVRTDSLDCTTFVENVLALYLASAKQNPEYRDYIESLTRIRYRDGKIHGYTSRLHYFSDWVEDNQNKGILKELTTHFEHETIACPLNYMTEHSHLYKQLKDNDSLLSVMRHIEQRWSEYEMPYVPKKLLDLSASEIKIKDGDILALTTSIDGLDVVHLGFAIWIDDSLHLLHASSLQKKVILDDVPLYDYLKGKSKHTGIRVIRVQ